MSANWRLRKMPGNPTTTVTVPKKLLGRLHTLRIHPRQPLDEVIENALEAKDVLDQLERECPEAVARARREVAGAA